MKKLALLSLPVILVASAQAFATQNEFCGFYAGVSLGGAFRSGAGHTSSTTSITSGTDTLTATRDLKFDARKNAFLGSFAVGYGYEWCDDLYLGLEGFVNGSSHHSHTPTETTTLSDTDDGVTETLTYSNRVRAKLHSAEVGIDLRPGYVLCKNTMLYGRVGVAYNRLTLSSDPTFSFVEGTTSLPGSVSLRGHKNRGAFRIGGGLERMFCDNFAIRMDYVYTYYGKVSNTRSFTGSTTVGGVTTTAAFSSASSVKVTSNTTTLGLFYYW